MQFIGLTVGAGPTAAQAMAELAPVFSHVLPIHHASTAAEAAEFLGHEAFTDYRCTLLTICDQGADLAHTISELRALPALHAARTLIITEDGDLYDVHDAVDRGLIDGILSTPWVPGALADQARHEVMRFLAHESRKYPSMSAAMELAERLRQAGILSPVTGRESRLLRYLEAEAETVMTRMLRGMDEVLGPRPRLHLPPGTRLTRQDDEVEALFVALDGRVALERRTPVGKVLMHHATTGPLVGLLAFARTGRAYFTSRTTTEVTALHLTLEQIDRVLARDPGLAAAVASLAITSLDRRLRRAEQIQVEKISLVKEVEAQRAQVEHTLADLQKAHAELAATRESMIARERFATLGELSAGIAHELNNPVAAVKRAAAHLCDDVHELIASHHHEHTIAAGLNSARHRPALSTKEERRLKRELEAAVGSRQWAYQLVSLGVTDPQAAAQAARAGEAELQLLATASGMGTSLRNLDFASQRIEQLVASLRAYARPDAEPEDGVQLPALVADAVALLQHRLHGIDLRVEAQPVPAITAHPGQLEQALTNILANSIDALTTIGPAEPGAAKTIVVVLDNPTPEEVRIQIRDNGPGIEPELLAKIFEPRFTTKAGTVRFGLGMGLCAVKTIIDRHGGEITMESRPGLTRTEITLPITGVTPKEAK